MMFIDQIIDILEGSKQFLSTLKPSEWTELNRVMTTDVSPFPGKFDYSRTPYLRDVVDCLSPTHPAKIVSVMKGAQIGFSTGVIESGIGWIISENPGNILFLTGHSDLTEEAMEGKIDQMINSCGLRHLIRPNVLKKRNQRTGDTSKSKEFPGGKLTAGSASNHKLLAQRSVQYIFVDDYDDVKGSSKSDGSTTMLIKQRAAAYSSKQKIFFISTPRQKQTSNIEPLFLSGDQRYWKIPCPHCKNAIAFKWSTPFENSDGKEMAGITWKLDNHNRLITDSVGYICQKCGGFFDDSNKQKQLLDGFWDPENPNGEDGHYSFHISALYAPHGMYDWTYYVKEFIDANPPEASQKTEKQQAFLNLALGETFEQVAESPKANQLQKNIRNYSIATVPEKLSEKDGNGQIMLLTCAADLNGTLDDARLDYEIVAWSETGSSYSVTHGSIGTFIPREGSKKNKTDRTHWTYEHGRANSVWPELTKILQHKFPIEGSDNKIRVAITGIDTGYHELMVFEYINKSNLMIRAVKGDKEHNKFSRIGLDVPFFKQSRANAKLILIPVGRVKDAINEHMKLKWDQNQDESQPFGFMNYPTPADGLYLYSNFFSHYEAEHKRLEYKDGVPVGSKWEKKTSTSQNHFWDVRIYNLVMRDWLANQICREEKMPRGGWAEFVELTVGKK